MYLIDINGNILGVVGSINYETGEFSFSVASCSEEPINICAIPDDPNIDLDDETYPTIEIVDVEIGDPDDGDDQDLSPEDELPVPDVGDATGDPDDGDGDTTDPVTDDPNNIITINDFTPESDPNKCS